MAKQKTNTASPNPNELRRQKLKTDFIQALASFMSQDLSRKSIALELGQDWAKDWAKVRNASGLVGWLDEMETQKYLMELLQ